MRFSRMNSVSRLIFQTNSFVKRCLKCNSKQLNSTQFCSLSSLPYKIDRYRGIRIDLKLLESNNIEVKDFANILKRTLPLLIHNVPILLSVLIPSASQLGFTFHHADSDHSVLCMWLNAKYESKIPQYASHQVGVAGCCIDEENAKVLVVKDKGRFGKYWKFPGGLSDLSEDISDTATREVKEETGVLAEFKSILAIRQHHDFPTAFGKSDLFVVTRLKPITFEIQPCSVEIEDCKWMDLAELMLSPDKTPITTRVSQLILHGLNHGFEDIDFVSHKFKSVYEGQIYWLYHSQKLLIYDY